MSHRSSAELALIEYFSMSFTQTLFDHKMKSDFKKCSKTVINLAFDAVYEALQSSFCHTFNVRN